MASTLTTTLASPDDLADALGVPATDPKLVSALRRASARFRGAVRWSVVETTETVHLDGHGIRSVRLPGKRVTACTVTLDGVVLVDGRDYDWSEDGILDRLGGRWPNRRRCIVATVTYGYPADAIPDDIQEAVIDQASALYRMKRGLSSKQVGGITENYGSIEAVGTSEQWASAVAAHRIEVGDRA